MSTIKGKTRHLKVVGMPDRRLFSTCVWPNPNAPAVNAGARCTQMPSDRKKRGVNSISVIPEVAIGKYYAES
jgi:hypothetical protein